MRLVQPRSRAVYFLVLDIEGLTFLWHTHVTFSKFGSMYMHHIHWPAKNHSCSYVYCSLLSAVYKVKIILICMLLFISLAFTSHVASTIEQQHCQPSEGAASHPAIWWAAVDDVKRYLLLYWRKYSVVQYWR